MSVPHSPRRRVQTVRASSPYIELELDIDFDAPDAEPEPVVAPEPAGGEPQSVKAAIIRWLDTRC